MSVFKRLIQAGLAMLLLAISSGCQDTDSSLTPDKWDYENPDWHSIGYPECGSDSQSPVNIDTTQTIKSQLPALTIHYQSMPLLVINNGHTVELIGNGTSYVQQEGIRYYLRQLHFHRTSEHSINGQRRVMELHLVHQDSVAGKRIVLAVFLGNGQTNPALEPVFSHLPTVPQTEPVAMPGISINPGDLLPGNRGYYRYRGSLTTPPCSQGLDWLVYQSSIPLSSDQQAAFAKLYPANNRPTQPFNNRVVFEQN